MKAMILAAGLGTRLRPLTDTRPKALVEVGNRTLLELAIAQLRASGVDEVIINVHHFADMIVDYLKSKHNFRLRIEISREEVLLDTGGGLKKAAYFFCEHSQHSDEPFIVHNVDVVSAIDLRRMVQCHIDSHALATLAVQQRDTSRYLLFDQHLQLCGRRAGCDGTPELVRISRQLQAMAFSGIHVISPRIFELLNEEGVFPIVPVYLRLAAQGESIRAFRADEYYWRDLGKPEDLAQAAVEMQQRGIGCLAR
jgi:NDP-sugar pyrophosphorylase family protein